MFKNMGAGMNPDDLSQAADMMSKMNEKDLKKMMQGMGNHSQFPLLTSRNG